MNRGELVMRVLTVVLFVGCVVLGYDLALNNGQLMNESLNAVNVAIQGDLTDLGTMSQ